MYSSGTYAIRRDLLIFEVLMEGIFDGIIFRFYVRL
jgi:hypothetical protein